MIMVLVCGTYTVFKAVIICLFDDLGDSDNENFSI